MSTPDLADYLHVYDPTEGEQGPQVRLCSEVRGVNELLFIDENIGPLLREDWRDISFRAAHSTQSEEVTADMRLGRPLYKLQEDPYLEYLSREAVDRSRRTVDNVIHGMHGYSPGNHDRYQLRSGVVLPLLIARMTNSIEIVPIVYPEGASKDAFLGEPGKPDSQLNGMSQGYPFTTPEISAMRNLYKNLAAIARLKLEAEATAEV